MIVFTHDADGGFVCGCTESRKTSYAYPTSTYARAARRDPGDVATEMLLNERRFGLPHEQNSDARHWRTLEGLAK